MEDNTMTKRETVMNALEAMGYKPQVDNDGDIYLYYQLKAIYVLETQQEDSDYLAVVLPMFYEMKEGEEVKTLAACNKATRELRQIKVFVDRTLKDVTASCEFYYCDEQCLRSQLERSLDYLGKIRTVFKNYMTEFDEE